MTPGHSTPNQQPSIELHIEELVLHGFALRDRDRISRAVERELKRLLTAYGLSPALAKGQEIARIDCGSFQLAPFSKPDETGDQVARAVVGGLRP